MDWRENVKIGEVYDKTRQEILETLAKFQQNLQWISKLH